MEIYKLNNETIQIISEKIGEMYREAGCTNKERLRASLLMEEALLKYKSRVGEGVELYFRSYRLFGQYRFVVRIRAQSFDPFTLEENPMAFMIQSILSTIESGAPTWKYRNMENEVVFTIHKKTKVGSLSKILIFLAAALVIGLIVRFACGVDNVSGFVADYITPFSDAYAALFCVMAVLLTFFAITLSIVHIGDMASVGALGGKVMRRFFTISGIAAVVVSLPVVPFLGVAAGGELNVAVKSIYDILIGFIPSNLVAPFLNFNSVHIMIIGAMFGFSLLVMGQKGSNLVEIFDECNLVAVNTNNFLNKFIAIYVALKVFALITTSQLVELRGAGKMIIAIIVAEILLLIFYTLYTCIKTKRKIKSFAKSVTPGFLVCLTSANFGAAFSTLFDSMLGGGVDGDTVSLTINLGSVFCRPASSIAFVLSAYFMASEYGLQISAAWIVIAIILSIILASTMPNIPGASIAALTLLFTQLGIPAEALTLTIAIFALLQFVTVAVDTWCLQGEIFCVYSDKLKYKAAKAKAKDGMS